MGWRQKRWKHAIKFKESKELKVKRSDVLDLIGDGSFLEPCRQFGIVSVSYLPLVMDSLFEERILLSGVFQIYFLLVLLKMCFYCL